MNTNTWLITINNMSKHVVLTCKWKYKQCVYMRSIVRKFQCKNWYRLSNLSNFFFISYEVDQRARDFDRTMIIGLNITVSTDIFNDKTRNHFMFMPKVTTNILLCVKFWLNLVTPLSKRTLVQYIWLKSEFTPAFRLHRAYAV